MIPRTSLYSMPESPKTFSGSCPLPDSLAQLQPDLLSDSQLYLLPQLNYWSLFADALVIAHENATSTSIRTGRTQARQAPMPQKPSFLPWEIQAVHALSSAYAFQSSQQWESDRRRTEHLRRCCWTRSASTTGSERGPCLTSSVGNIQRCPARPSSASRIGIRPCDITNYKNLLTIPGLFAKLQHRKEHRSRRPTRTAFLSVSGGGVGGGKPFPRRDRRTSMVSPASLIQRIPPCTLFRPHG